MGTNEGAAAIHSALVRMVAEWTTSDLQASVASSAGVELDPSEVRALYLLGLAGGSMGASALADQAHLTRPTTSKLITRLAIHGLVDRIRSGRSLDVHLTPSGEEAYRALVLAGHAMVLSATEGWPDAEVESFRRQLVRFVQALPHGGATDRERGLE